jgi:hypothetical protein
MTVDEVRAAGSDHNTIFHFTRPGKACERWRINGSMQTWKTRPTEFRIPVKHGLRAYGQITHRTLIEYPTLHLPGQHPDCNTAH